MPSITTVVLLLGLVAVPAYGEVFWVPDEDGRLHRVDPSETNGDAVDVQMDDLSLHVYTRAGREAPVTVKLRDVEQIKGTGFDASRRSFFLSHGWTGTINSVINIEARRALLDMEDSNVLVMDWSSWSNRSYITSRNSVDPIGIIFAEYIQRLMAFFGMKSSQIVLAGHSMGAHMCGAVGMAHNGSLPLIVGLDPAYPVFGTAPVETRLDASDAKHVLIIHTNAGKQGFGVSIGDADFYPNGGTKQAGCEPDADGRCAHQRSTYYYAESIRGGNFTGTSCDSYDRYKEGGCDANEKVHMGGLDVDVGAKGDYYLDTNPESPFSMG